MQLLQQGLFCLAAFLTSANVLTNGAQGVQGVAGQYLLGLGIGDITGPVVETNMMGYASLAQTDTGLHMRQRSRAWIVADANNATNRIVFINADIAMGDTGIRRSIVKALSQQYPQYYNNDNIALVSTHQHSGITALGYVKQTADAIVAGTVLAVQRAHNSLAPGNLSLGNTSIVDGNINRSPSAYLANPADERARYQYDQDKDLTLLRFDDATGNARGFLSFFAVHGTSLYENNTLVSSDNKGMAAYLYEHMVEPNSMPGNNTFIAGFTQSNVGDTSPNTLGAFCESPGEAWDGQPCEFVHSTCGNKTEDCHGRGPGFLISDFESNRIIGQHQVDAAASLMGQKLPAVTGAVKYVHTYMNMSFRQFQLPNGTTVETCPPAMGFSFAGGTTDGPGAFDFIQGDNSTSQNPFWEIVKSAVTPPPTQQQIDCQAPKPILLNTGFAHFPYEWSPSTVDIQMLRVGNFVMLIIPGELTTMSGRRLRDAVRAKLISQGVIGDDAYVAIAGPCEHEYGAQRYEGASTIFGKWTLDSYIDKYGSLVSYLADNATGQPPSDPAPVDQTGKAISLQTGVVFDSAGIGHKFGDVMTDVRTTSAYTAGEAAIATFNNLRLEQTFLSVDQLVNSQWKSVRSDSHPSTTYQWKRTSTILGTSTVNITWVVEDGTPAGTYRLTYFGDQKPFIGNIGPFVGHSSNFTISA
ncbi:Neutral/alkaline nonlysosomal ceramidase [Ganoderma leucocontextum]|nr:Neutral/alkaline nonlysosomal ceramidase [Ganoderma leucocontextum]